MSMDGGVSPDPNCAKCGGKGDIYEQQNDVWGPCECTVTSGGVSPDPTVPEIEEG